MSSDRTEWVEIIEPRTKEHMYANLTTGECVWDPPEGVSIKRTDSSQWWELFDTNTERFYYYNVASQTTVWHRPSNCDIIPLAKLQTLKQNTDPGDKCDGYLHAPHSKTQSNAQKNENKAGHHRHHSSSGGSDCVSHSRIRLGGDEIKGSSEFVPSPQARHSYRLPSLDKSPGISDGKPDSFKYCKHGQASRNQKHKEKSGKSSDSSISSAHVYRRLHDVGGSLRIASSNQHKNKHFSEKNYRLFQENSSSCNIPHIPPYLISEKQTTQTQIANSPPALGSVLPHFPHSKLPYSISNSSDLSGLSPTRSMNSPNLTKKMEGAATEKEKVIKPHSLDHPGSGVILTRSGSFMSSPTSTYHLPLAQLQQTLEFHNHSAENGSGSVRPCKPRVEIEGVEKSAADAIRLEHRGGHYSDDSMHEKYFKSVENTPITRRRHIQSTNANKPKHSSDSSPQSPVSPKNHSSRPSVLSSLSALEVPTYFRVTSAKSKIYSQELPDSNFLNLDLTTKPERYLDKIKFDKTLPNSKTGTNHQKGDGLSKAQETQQKLNNILVSSSSSGGGSGGKKQPGKSASHFSNDCNIRTSAMRKPTALEQYLSKPNVDRHNEEIKNAEKGKSRRRQHHIASSDAEHDNGNISPLYSNWDQEHLLPLQHYIIEQAKLSGCYGFGDPLDSDSFHSDSQSEHSFSGHEPDNEDSDHSDGHGDYLTHNYGLMGDFAANIEDGTSYYSFHLALNRSDVHEDISSNVEDVLENERESTQIYSPISGHPYYTATQQAKTSHLNQLQHQHHPSPSDRKQPNNQKSGQLPSPHRHLPRQLQHQPQSVPEISESSNLNKRKQKEIQHNTIEQNKQITDRSRLSEMQQRFTKQISMITPSTLQNISVRSTGSISSADVSGINAHLAIMKECDIEKFAQDNLNLHSKGLFRKKSSVRDMLSWTADAISRPMLALARDKAGKKMATELFKLVQIYMGDRKARSGMSLNSVVMDVIQTALGQQQLRDELYVQLCRQTTENPKRESLIRGWELIAICLSFLPPSPTFQPALLNYMNRHRDPTFASSFPEVGKWPIHVQISHYATVCCRRLDRIGSTGKKQAKKPTEDEIEQAREQILRDSMFGNTLEEVMGLQKDKYPDRKLPWIQVTLSEQVLLLGGKQTEGIFRVSADVDEVNSLKNVLDRWEILEHKNTMDAHAPASLLKLWYRELYDPLIPDKLYDECVQTEDPEVIKSIIGKLPEINKLVLSFLIHFLQQFAHPDVVSLTKMDSSNLAMVFAPNCLRCTSQDPKIILENARKEMAFLRTLIQNMDTSNIANLM